MDDKDDYAAKTVAICVACLLVAVAVAVYKQLAYEPVAADQCHADYYQCNVNYVRICSVGSVARGCEFVGEGKSDCRLVEDCG